MSTGLTINVVKPKTATASSKLPVVVVRHLFLFFIPWLIAIYSGSLEVHILKAFPNSVVKTLTFL